MMMSLVRYLYPFWALVSFSMTPALLGVESSNIVRYVALVDYKDHSQEAFEFRFFISDKHWGQIDQVSAIHLAPGDKISLQVINGKNEHHLGTWEVGFEYYVHMRNSPPESDQIAKVTHHQSDLRSRNRFTMTFDNSVDGVQHVGYDPILATGGGKKRERRHEEVSKPKVGTLGNGITLYVALPDHDGLDEKHSLQASEEMVDLGQVRWARNLIFVGAVDRSPISVNKFSKPRGNAERVSGPTEIAPYPNTTSLWYEIHITVSQVGS